MLTDNHRVWCEDQTYQPAGELRVGQLVRVSTQGYNTRIDEIVLIEPIETTSKRYDIEVEGAHNFFANGILVHNCQNLGRTIFGYEDEHIPFDTTDIPEEALISMKSKGELEWARLDGPPGKWYKVRKAVASRDTRYEVTIKLDGSSMTAYVKKLDGEPYELKGVCSRNLDLKLEGNDDNAFVKMAHPEILELIAHQGGDVALQGELCGPSIQGNREGFTVNRFFIYNILDIKTGEFMTPPARRLWVQHANDVAETLFGRAILEHVPVLHEGVTLGELGITNMEELLKFAEGPSMHNKVREGLVFKAINGEHQFKVISNEYLLAEK